MNIVAISPSQTSNIYFVMQILNVKYVRGNKGRKKRHSKSAKEEVRLLHTTGAESDIETALLSRAMGENPTSGTFLPYVLYSSTSQLRRMAYTHGVSSGRLLYLLHGDSGVDPMLTFLGKSDLGNVLYNPSHDGIIIRSSRRAMPRTDCKKKMHYTEAGIISGYLSAQRGYKIDVCEIECREEGKGHCLFVISRENGIAPYYDASKDSPLESLSSAIISKVSTNAGSDYCMLMLMPVLSTSLSHEASKLLFSASANAAASHGSVEAAISGIVSLFDMKEGKIIKQKGRTSIAIRYKQYNSTNGFAEMGNAAVAGSLSGLYGRGVSIRRRPAEKNEYSAKFEVEG